MEDMIFCPNCHKRNGIYKFCTHCGHRLIEDEEFRLIFDNPEPYCLNCGRPVREGQFKCECGYILGDINCPRCKSKNPYTYRFCIECGEKLWTYNIPNIDYRKVKSASLIDRFPIQMRNTILHERYKKDFNIFFPKDYGKSCAYDYKLQSNESLMNYHLNEIFSRWKIVSPHMCINCFSEMKADSYKCSKCGTELPDGEKRVEYLKNRKYVRPVFDIDELKWNSKLGGNYVDSLAPAIGESQFEYRERLKWEYGENYILKIHISNTINRKQELEKLERQRREEEKQAKIQAEERERQEEERKRWEQEYIRQYGGGYCDSRCIHCYEEIIGHNGEIIADYTSDMCGVNWRCRLYSWASFGRFCKDYE